MENGMDVSRIQAMLDAAPRITELLKRLGELDAEATKLADERAAIAQELEQLTGQPASNGNGRTRAKQKCSICGSEDHNKRGHPKE